MTTLTVSSKGQIVLPVEIRRRLGLGTGTRMKVIEESDGVRLQVQRAVPSTDIAALAGMLTARPCGKPRRLEDFDPASVFKKSRKAP